MDAAPSLLAAELWRPHHLAAVPHLDAPLEVSSVVTHQSNGSHGGGGRRRPRRNAAPEDDSSKLVSTSGTGGGGGLDSADPEAKRLKLMKSSDNNDNLRTEVQTDSENASKAVDKNPTPSEPLKQDYIGQATDSHSLAERARREKISERREKISERMKILQDLVPGCNKVIGKSSVLDEIINYIQALQRQVEFLSMKLEAVNAHVNNRIVAIPSKDFGTQPYHTAPGLTFDPQTPREYTQGSTAEWLHMQIGNSYERVS